MASRRRFFIFIVAMVLIVAVVLLLFFFVFRDNTKRSLIDSSVNVSHHSNSAMHMNPNGTFTVSIMYHNSPRLTGIGTWSRSGDTYTFNYIDKWVWSGDNMVRLSPVTQTYDRVGRRLRFIDHTGNVFYFR